MKALPSLSISVVVYKPDIPVLLDTLRSLVESLHFAQMHQLLGLTNLWLIDNDIPQEQSIDFSTLLGDVGIDLAQCRLEVIAGHGNIGYGKGNNYAIMHASQDYHLVLNPDVILEKEAIVEAIRFMEGHRDVGLLSPSAIDEHGAYTYLCKRYPALFDLILRGFAPGWIKKLFDARLARYELRLETDQKIPFEPLIVSGCFMFFRLNLLKQIGGFSKDFFMYFEDFDLSLRIAALAKVMHVPSVRIKHFGGRAAKKGIRHVRMLLESALVFYRCHGFKLA